MNVNNVEKWVPVSEGSPDSYERVLVTAEGVVKIATYYDKKGLLFAYEWHGVGFYVHHAEIGYLKLNGVSAWRPLPKAFQEGE